MTPYYKDDWVTIYHGDCRDILPSLKADLCVTSPPYNKGYQSGECANMKDGYKSHSDDMPHEEYAELQSNILGLLWNCTYDTGGAIFYNHKPQIRKGGLVLPTTYIPDHVIVRQIIIWDRGSGVNQNPRFFCPQHEWVVLCAHPSFSLRQRGSGSAGDVWRIPHEHQRTSHPCPFPLSLCKHAIEPTTAKIVIDPFMGTGTTLRAAKDLNRRSIGIEIEEEYCETAATRMAQEVFDFGQ